RSTSAGAKVEPSGRVVASQDDRPLKEREEIVPAVDEPIRYGRIADLVEECRPSSLIELVAAELESACLAGRCRPRVTVALEDGELGPGRPLDDRGAERRDLAVATRHPVPLDIEKTLRPDEPEPDAGGIEGEVQTLRITNRDRPRSDPAYPMPVDDRMLARDELHARRLKAVGKRRFRSALEMRPHRLDLKGGVAVEDIGTRALAV